MGLMKCVMCISRYDEATAKEEAQLVYRGYSLCGACLVDWGAAEVFLEQPLEFHYVIDWLDEEVNRAAIAGMGR